MLRAPMNDQIEVIPLMQAQCFAHTARLIWVFRNMHLPAIWAKQMLYSFSSSVQGVVMMLVAGGGTERCLSALDEGCRGRRHHDSGGIQRKRCVNEPICYFYSSPKARTSRESSAISGSEPVATEWLLVIDECALLIGYTALTLVNKQE